MTTHRAHDDLQGILTGSVLAALGISLFNEAGILGGGTVGLALLLNYASGLDLSLALLLANAPFYALACLRMGREFTLKTLAVMLLTSLWIKLLPSGVGFSHLSPVLAAVLGGLLAGVGMLALFRHRASLGGLNVLVLYLQDKLGWSPGKMQMLLDAAILVAGSLVFMDWRRLGVSLIGAVTLNLVLAVNHRPGRYSPART
jgi:uncharacterized membrane-anchored protein YitT (DUF2179 family)